jgi:adenylate kinase
MKNIIFLGAPGCGKGTQASLICSSMNYATISTGNLLRDMAKQKNSLGEKIEALLSKGALVSDRIVNQLIEDFYKKALSEDGVILDGYPRNLDQAKSLDFILDKHQIKIDLVVYFELAEEVLLKRITGRYTCKDCGAIYNSYFSNTKISGECDKCGSHDFDKRSDDSEQVIIDRLKVFRNNTKPLLDYYADKLVTIDASQPSQNVSEEIIKKLK